MGWYDLLLKGGVGSGGARVGAGRKPHHVEFGEDQWGNGRVLNPPYSKIDLGTKLVKVDEKGTVKLTKPKTPQEAMEIMTAMDKVATVAKETIEDIEKNPNAPKGVLGHSQLQYRHVLMQVKRAVGLAKKMADGKSILTDLQKMIEDMISKYGEPIYDDEPSTKGGAGSGGKREGAGRPKGDGSIKPPKPREAKPKVEKPHKERKPTKEESKPETTHIEDIKVPDKAETPREEAEKETLEQLKDPSEYLNARDSKFSNQGEDLIDSARHKAMNWKGLKEAEKDGTAKDMINRKMLLKNEPPDIIANTNEKNVYAALAMTIAMNRFPAEINDPYGDKPDETPLTMVTSEFRNSVSYFPKTEYGNRSVENLVNHGAVAKDVTVGQLRESTRETYYGLYQTLKNTAEDIVKSGEYEDEMNAVAKFKNVLRTEMDKIKYTNSDLFNQFVRTHNTDLGSVYKDTSVLGQLNKFKAMGESEFGHNNYMEMRGDLLPKALSIMEGKSMNAAFGKQGTRDIFDPEKHLTNEIIRKGPDIKEKSFDSQMDYLTKSSKIRGVQWGNSVTDAEREYHSQKLTESFKDLKDVLGLKDTDISYNGRLGIAVGARGKGGALAHYEPTMQVINLTRASGAGSLAHEWGHFLDFTTKNFEGESDVLKAAKNNIKTAIQKSGYPDRCYQYLKNQKVPPSKIYNYHLNQNELIARTFDAHVQNKLAENGRQNTYLTAAWKADNEYMPNKEEMKEISTAYDNFIKTLKATGYDKKLFKQDYNRKLLDKLDLISQGIELLLKRHTK